jgi:hypothetical protein
LGRAAFGPAGGQPFEKVAKHIKIKVPSTPSKNLFAPLFKSGPPQGIDHQFKLLLSARTKTKIFFRVQGRRKF